MLNSRLPCGGPVAFLISQLIGQANRGSAGYSPASSTASHSVSATESARINYRRLPRFRSPGARDPGFVRSRSPCTCEETPRQSCPTQFLGYGVLLELGNIGAQQEHVAIALNLTIDGIKCRYPSDHPQQTYSAQISSVSRSHPRDYL